MSKDIKDLILSDQYKNQFAMVLPKIITPDRFVRVAMTALTRNPKLMQCTPASLMGCLLEAAQMGLEVDGRRAHLIPYGKVCTLIVDYKGLAELAMRSGLVSHIHADIVCYEDEFDENMGRVTKHKINRKAVRGDMYAAYSHVVMKDGTESFQIMSKDEVDGIRKRSKAANNGPWVTDYNEMAKKTVFRRHAKWLPLSPELRDALDKDPDVAIDITPQVIVEPFMEPDAVPALAEGKSLKKPPVTKAPVAEKPKAEPKKPKKRVDPLMPKAAPEPEPEQEAQPEPEPAPQDEEREITAEEWEEERDKERDAFVDKAVAAQDGLKDLDMPE